MFTNLSSEYSNPDTLGERIQQRSDILFSRRHIDKNWERSDNDPARDALRLSFVLEMPKNCEIFIVFTLHIIYLFYHLTLPQGHYFYIQYTYTRENFYVLCYAICSGR
jgi:hypothetical protein